MWAVLATDATEGLIMWWIPVVITLCVSGALAVPLALVWRETVAYEEMHRRQRDA